MKAYERWRPCLASIPPSMHLGAKQARQRLNCVTEMHGASLHRRHRFRGVQRGIRPQPSIRPAKAAALRLVQTVFPPPQPAKAASRLGLPHALQDASRSRGRWASCRKPSLSGEFESSSCKDFDCMVTTKKILTREVRVNRLSFDPELYLCRPERRGSKERLCDLGKTESGDELCV